MAAEWLPFLGQPVVVLASGVRGVTHEDPDGTLVILLIVAEHEGQGDVGRYLDSLQNRRVAVAEVTSQRLLGMLERRGYRRQRFWETFMDEWVTAWVHEPYQIS